jgi:hypothetical protein
MGKASRRKRERRQHDHATDLRRAMRQVDEEDRRAAVAAIERIAAKALGRSPHGVKADVFVLTTLLKAKPYPCLMCDSTELAGVVAWRPNEACLRRHFGLPPGHIAAVLYPICRQCAARCQESHSSWSGDIEDRILTELRKEEWIPSEPAR